MESEPGSRDGSAVTIPQVSGRDSFYAGRCVATADRKAAAKATQRSAKRTTGKASKGFTAARLHALIKSTAPALSPRTWYGMPAYAKDGNVICFFQSGHKFKSRYAALVKKALS